MLAARQHHDRIVLCTVGSSVAPRQPSAHPSERLVSLRARLSFLVEHHDDSRCHAAGPKPRELIKSWGSIRPFVSYSVLCAFFPSTRVTLNVLSLAVRGASSVHRTVEDPESDLLARRISRPPEKPPVRRATQSQVCILSIPTSFRSIVVVVTS